MIGSIQSRIPQRSIVVIDVLIVAWTVMWVVLGIAVGTFVDRLGAVGEGLEDAGHAIGRAADAVGDLSGVPVVGEGFGVVASEIHDVSRETADRGRAVEADVNTLAVMIGASLALAPTLPILVLWVPMRVARERERLALRTSLRAEDDAALAYLASRALATRSFRELRTVVDDPVRDIASGRYEALAALELDHLGLTRRARSAAGLDKRDARRRPSRVVPPSRRDARV